MNPRILVIDADPDGPDVAAALETLPASVELASTVEQALASALGASPDVILLNLGMPDASGLDALRSLRLLAPVARLPVVVLARNPTEQEQVAAYDLGVEEILGKPMPPSLVANRVRTVLARLERNRDIEPHPGMLFDSRFRIVRQIGRGGMGSVYQVEPARGGPPLALKLFHREGGDHAGQIDRFLREVQVLSCLVHPHLIRVFDSGIVDGRGYYVMDYLKGGTLHDRLTQQPDYRLAPLDALEITAKVAGALALAHDHQLLHRDLKPDNILFDDHGEPVVTDFGLVFDAGAQRPRRITDSGTIVGTPHYMSPEQILSPGDLDCRSDVFSLGIILYEMLTGDVPFSQHAGIDAMLKLAREDITPPIYHAPEIGSAANLVCARALRRDRDQRYPSAAELAAATRKAINELRPPAD